MRPRNLLHLYRVRARARFLQELFAIVGIAAGVALLFASQIASSSLSSSVGSLNAGIVGRAQLQLTARSAQGMPMSLLKRVRQTAGVEVAAPLLEASAQAVGPKAGESVQLVGVDPSLKQLHGSLVSQSKLSPFAGFDAVVLPAPLARTLGVRKFGATVSLRVAGHTAEASLYERLSSRQIGGLASSPIVVTTLSAAQEIIGYGHVVSRILVQAQPGRVQAVRAALSRVAAGRLNVESAAFETRLFSVAAEATNQSTQLFAVISALVGFLFAFNAVLLTVAQRRRLIAELRRDGYTPAAVLAVLLFDALVLALVACALGLLIGDQLSIHLFHATPGYLSSAFAIGSQRVISAQSIAVAVGGGLLAALVAVLSPLRDVLSKDPLAALRVREGGGLRRTGLLAAAGVVTLSASVAILLAAAQQAVIGTVLLAVSMMLLLPVPLSVALAAVRRVAPRFVSAVPHVAAMELHAGYGRALAITATGAIAVFGAVAIDGAHRDLLGGLEAAAAETNALTDLWVAPAGSYDRLFTAPFAPRSRQLRRLRALPQVRAVRLYRGGLLDVGDRRVWVIAPPAQSHLLLPAGQVTGGDPARASRELRSGGWAVLSSALVAQLHVRVGQEFTLPSPTPLRLRLAAVSTNVGWAPGAVMISAQQFARGWGADASAYDVLLKPGVSPAAATAAVDHVLGGESGLAVQSAAARAAQLRAVSRQGLQRLSQIATLILIAAVLAMAAAMGAMIWQRRPRLAKLKLEGFSRAELWRTLLAESVILLGSGCLTGALFGLLGEQLLDRALANVIDYPVRYAIDAPLALLILALVTAAASIVVSAPGWLAARVPAGLALQD
ncbi:MAG: ABC transporter permease [Solirubrobacteraceae bacterium]